MTKPVQSYRAEGIVVRFDPNVCEHTGICLRGLPEVFDIREKRWIRPERAAIEAVVAQVGRCPSGALTVTVDAGSTES